MKVVLATHRTDQWLGVNKYFYQLGKHLSNLGVDVKIVVDSPKGCRAVREICGDIVRTAMVLPAATNVFSTARYCWNLSRYLEGQSFDVLHCGHVLPYFYLKKRRHRPVVFQPFGNELFTLSGRGINRLYCLLAQPVLAYCGENTDVLLSEGNFQDREMRIYYPRAKRLAILPVGVDTGAFRPKGNYSIDHRFQFLAVNSLLPYEHMDDVISAFRMVNGHSDLTIVGAGSEEARLRHMARGLQVEFRKNLPESELRLLYSKSDAFICATYETDLQMGVLEAMASGLPVILREGHWLPESAIWFRDNYELANKMAWVATISASTRREMAEKGLEWVKAYSFTSIAQKALKIYEGLLHNNKEI